MTSNKNITELYRKTHLINAMDMGIKSVPKSVVSIIAVAADFELKSYTKLR